jgi:uncharacterized iron-regulated protein
MSKRKYVEFPDVEVIRNTGKALLILFEDGREKWIPSSVIHDDSEVFDTGHEGDLLVQEWFVEKNGWPDDEKSS